MTIDLHRPGQLRSIALHREAGIDDDVTIADSRTGSVARRCAYLGL